MAETMTQPSRPRLPIRCERMAKAELASLTEREKRASYGQILKKASALANLNRDETARALGVDPSQVSRWWSGDENAQLWRYQQHPVLNRARLIAEAEADDSIEVETTLRIRQGWSGAERRRA